MSRQRLASSLVLAASLLALPRLATAMCGDLLIILDRSGSMAGCMVGMPAQTKESIAKKSISAIVDMYPSIPMGLAVFPDTLMTPASSCGTDRVAGCTKGKVVLDIAADGGPMIKDFLAKMPTSCGGTPTGDTMQLLKDYDKWTPMKNHFVLIITDGQPTCQDGEDGGTFDTGTMKCTPAPVCNGMGTCQCKNPTKVYDGIKTLFAKDVHTFVVGFEGMGSGAGCGDSGMPFNPAVLDMMADFGGEPQTGAATKYYSATNEMTLLEALKKILGKVGGGTGGGCIKTDGGGSSSDGGDTDGGGAGGAGAAGGGGGGGGGGGAAGGGGQGGAAGGGQDEDPPPDPTRKDPSCLCAAPGATGAGFGAAAALGSLTLAAAIAGRARSRRRRRR